MPEIEKRVIAQVEFGNKKALWEVMACYIPFKTVKEEDFMADEFQGEGDYDEETDTYYTPEGWYEQNLYSDVNYHISDKVVGWRPINRK